MNVFLFYFKKAWLHCEYGKHSRPEGKTGEYIAPFLGGGDSIVAIMCGCASILLTSLALSGSAVLAKPLSKEYLNGGTGAGKELKNWSLSLLFLPYGFIHLHRAHVVGVWVCSWRQTPEKIHNPKPTLIQILVQANSLKESAVKLHILYIYNPN